MPARILVVDDVPANVRLLEAKLSSEYFDVVTAADGPGALAALKTTKPDLVLLDVMMPGMDGFEVCREIKADVAVAHIPVVMVTALSDPSDRVRGLEAGADDFLTKPVNDVSLFARVRSLVRVKMMTDELRLREETSAVLGVSEGLHEFAVTVGDDTRILVVEDDPIAGPKLASILQERFGVMTESRPDEVLALTRGNDFDLAIVSFRLEAIDPLRLCSQIRSAEPTRQLPILALVDEGETQRVVKALELGVNDYLLRPVDRNELLARSKTQIRRKRYQDLLRQNYHRSMSLAVTDAVTGLYNRHYMASHLDNTVTRATAEAKTVSVMMIDIDFFKVVNDTHGHGAGDEVLAEVAARIQRNVRGIDLAARYGGEEFVVVMPDTDLGFANHVAERVRRAVAEAPFQVAGGPERGVRVTCSIGVCGGATDPVDLLKRADQALYRAKGEGRNRVVIDDATREPEAARLAQGF